MGPWALRDADVVDRFLGAGDQFQAVGADVDRRLMPLAYS
jgi:hypothetical protein